MNMHPWVDTLWSISASKNKFNKVLTEILEEKAKEIKKAYGIVPGSQFAASRCLDEILDLSTEPEHCTKDCVMDMVDSKHKCTPTSSEKCRPFWWCHEHQTTHKPKDMGEHSESICTDNHRTSCNHNPKDLEVYEHQYFGPNDNFHWCPLCGIPRPKERTFREVMSDELYRVIIDKEMIPRVCEDSGQAEWTVGEARHLALALTDKALTTLREFKEKV